MRRRNHRCRECRYYPSDARRVGQGYCPMKDKLVDPGRKVCLLGSARHKVSIS